MSSSENDSNGNQNDDKEKNGGPPQPVGFFDHRLRHVRRSVTGKWLLTTTVLMIFILSVLSICQYSWLPHSTLC